MGKLIFWPFGFGGLRFVLSHGLASAVPAPPPAAAHNVFRVGPGGTTQIFGAPPAGTTQVFGTAPARQGKVFR